LYFRLKNKDNYIESLKDRLSALQTQLSLLTTQMRKCEDDTDKFKNQHEDLMSDIEMIENEIATLNNEKEDEVNQKLEIESEIVNRHEAFERNLDLHQEQFLEMLNTSKQEELDKAKAAIENEYEARLTAAMNHLKQECEIQLDANRQEQEELYIRKEISLRGSLELLQKSFQTKSADLDGIQSKLSGIEAKCNSLEAQGNTLRNNLSNMEQAWKADKAGFAAEEERLQQIIFELQLERQEMLGDYQGLLEIKVALLNEIETYRTLLEGEEHRLVLIK